MTIRIPGVFTVVLPVPDSSVIFVSFPYSYPTVLYELYEMLTLTRGMGVHLSKISRCGQGFLYVLYTVAGRFCSSSVRLSYRYPAVL